MRKRLEPPIPTWSILLLAAFFCGIGATAAAQEEKDDPAAEAPMEDIEEEVVEEEAPPPPPPPFDSELRLESVTADSVTVSWKSEKSDIGTVLVRPVHPGRADPDGWLAGGTGMMLPSTGAQTIMVREDEARTGHSVTVGGLLPGARYEILAQPGKGERPEEGLAFFTAPEPGRMQVLRLKIAVVVFTSVTREKDSEQTGASKPPPPEYLERIRKDVDAAALFYFVNSGMRVFLDLDYLESDSFIAVKNDAPYGVAYGNGENKALDALLAEKGKKRRDYDGYCFISCEKHFSGGAWTCPGSGGGTYGPLAPYPVGRSAWKSGSDNGWLFCHEFGHQLDALYAESGMKRFLFNHFQPWDDTAHCHGEHWDGNAWLLREWAGHVTRERQTKWQPGSLGFRYFTSHWGEVFVTMDEDADGVPDRDLELPLDEKRLGSHTRKADTDGDGLGDLAEAMACNWVEHGLGEIWAGPPESHRCDPDNPDTDGDGVRDGDDPAPLFGYPTAIPPAKPVLDGKISEGEWMWSAPFEDAAFSGTVYLGWDREALYFAFASAGSASPKKVRLLVDANRDGWYVGGDNFHVNAVPAGGCADRGTFKADESGHVEFALHNCGVEDKWPFYDEEGLETGAVVAAADETVVEVKILRNEERGLMCRPGETLGISIAVDPGTGEPRPGRSGLLTLFEPHTFCEFRLTP